MRARSMRSASDHERARPDDGNMGQNAMETPPSNRMLKNLNENTRGTRVRIRDHFATSRRILSPRPNLQIPTPRRGFPTTLHRGLYISFVMDRDIALC
jgi:hypothetical protein